MAEKEHHPVPLWTLFLALVALTVAEVALYEVWSRNQEMMPKYAMVLLLMVFTIPKAAIVFIYFMHLKFEKHLVITLAIIPFFLASMAVLSILSDIVTLRDQSDFNEIPGLREFVPSADGGHGHGDGHGDASPPSHDEPAGSDGY